VPEKKIANDKPVTDAERLEAGEREAEARQKEDREARLREVIRSEMTKTWEMQAANGGEQPTAEAKARAAHNAAEYAEEQASVETAYEKALRRVADATGGHLASRVPIPQYWNGQARGKPSISSPTILQRLQGGDPEPMIRTLKFFRAIADGDIREARQHAGRTMGRALSAEIGAAGGLLIPEEFSNDVVLKLGELTPFASREFMRVIPMGSDVKRVPRLITLPAATYGEENADWSTDAGKGTEPRFGEVELVARDAMLIVGSPENLFDDAGPDVMQLLIDLFAQALARLRNLKVLSGNGTSEPEGVIGAVGVTNTSYDNTDQDTKQDTINAWFHDVKEQYRGAAIFAISDAALEVFNNIRDTTGQPIMSRMLDEPFMRLKGKPVFTTDALTTIGVFGNFLYYLFGDRQAMQTMTARGGDYFRKRQIGIRVIERYDGKIAQEEAFATMDTIS
jgi:HK97 family phage major capsid protein